MKHTHQRRFHRLFLLLALVALVTLETPTVWADEVENAEEEAADENVGYYDGGDEADVDQEQEADVDYYEQAGDEEEEEVEEEEDEEEEAEEEIEEEGYYDAEEADAEQEGEVEYYEQEGEEVEEEEQEYYEEEPEDEEEEYYYSKEDVEDFIDGLSIMPLSCIKYNQEHMIKFQFLSKTQNDEGEEVCLAGDDDENAYGTYVVPVADYMRAYFNYQVLLQGTKFKMPHNAGYLQCAMLQHSYTDEPIYAKIGCMEKEALTTTQLRLHLYSDEDCTTLYDDGRSDSLRGIKGYNVNGTYFNPKVTFKPPFYSCSTCKPEEISQYFTKDGSYWLDDDAAERGDVSYQYFDDWVDDFDVIDDAWQVVSKYMSNARTYFKSDDDGNDDGERRLDEKRHSGRKLEDGADEWNMCTQLLKYGEECDEECLAISSYTISEWTEGDYVLLAVICGIMTLLMTIIYKKKSYAYRMELEGGKQRCCGQCLATFWHGLPLLFSAVVFFVIVATLALFFFMHLVNETLVVGIMVCILLFIYTLNIPSYKSTKTPLLGKDGAAA